MDSQSKISEINQAKEFLSKPTAKRVRLAADILLRVAYSEAKGFCEPTALKVIRFEEKAEATDRPPIKLKKHICAICPSCRSLTFDLNTEIMKGQCLSCAFKSDNYKEDMVKLR